MIGSVRCPTCGKTVQWSGTHRWRPFCSERCRLVDLGDWLSSANSIPEEIDPDVDALLKDHDIAAMPHGRLRLDTKD
jgi:endogenous inhibitor of DNA gyrase (YacG/DUF329 family)